MLSLEQIRRLENRVYKAVELLKAMKEDNNILKSELISANERVEELEQIISDYRNNQLEIEQGIVKAIQQLDDIDSFDESSENSEEPVLSAAVSSETVQENFPIEIEEESSIPVTIDITSNSDTDESAETVVETETAADKESVDETESVHNENSQQLDIF